MAPSSALNRPVKILYVAGSGRSGSTLLANMLGSIDGFLSVGELWYLWDRGLIDDRRCGCGEPFSKCAFWSSVVTDVGIDRHAAGRVVAGRDIVARTRRAPRMLRRSALAREAGAVSYLGAVERLYHAIARQSDARIIVDASKAPVYGTVISMLDSLEVYVVHIVRDARAVAYSWKRQKRQPDKPGVAYLTRHGVIDSTVTWAVENGLSDFLLRRRATRYLRIRYEDFIVDVPETLRRVAALVDEPLGSLDFIHDEGADLSLSHTVSGNPMRFSVGPVALRPDDEWRRQMPRATRTLAGAMAWPLQLRYGYVSAHRTGRPSSTIPPDERLVN